MRRSFLPLLAGAVAGLVLAVGAAIIVRAAVERQAEERLRLDLDRLADDAVALPPGASRHDFVRVVARWLNARCTWIGSDGRVEADSDVAPDRIGSVESHASRPEVVAARRSGTGEDRRTSATVGERFVYVAHRLDGPGGGGFLRVALPEVELSRMTAPYRWNLLLLGLLGGLLAGGAVVAVGRRRDRDLALVSEAMDTVARGGTASGLPLAADLERIRERLSDVARRAAAAERGDQGIRLLSRIVFEELPEALLVVDPSLRLLDANPAAARLFGASTAVPALLVDLVRSPGVHAAFEQALREEHGVSTTVTVLSDQGADRILEVAVRPVPGPRLGGLAAAVGLIRDVTDREKAEAMRRQFVADVSHELRTPIAGVRAAAETAAQEEGVGPELAQLLAIVDRQARQMEDLVSDLTDLSQIEIGAVTLSIERHPVRAILGDVLRDLAPAASRRGVTVVLETPPSVTVDGDPRRLAQVFRNLLDNAIKFSPDGATVTVSAWSGPRGEAIVAVKDQGRGIPRSDHQKVFQRFYRVDPSRAKTVPGTGLGLAIVKHLLILHGGTIQVDSELGRGSTFTVVLPLRLAESPGA